MKFKHLLFGALGVAVAAGAFIWATRSGDSGSSKDGSDASEASGGRSAARRAVPRGLEARMREALRYKIPSGSTPSGMEGLVGSGKYPPGSIPLDPSKRAHIFPNAGAERTSPIGGPPLRVRTAGGGASEDPAAGGGDGEESAGLSYVLKADKYAIAGGDVLNVTLEVYREDAHGLRTPVPAKIHSGVVSTPPKRGDPGHKAAAMTYADDGVDGDLVARDLVYTSRFVPARSPIAGEPGIYFLVVQFNPEGESQSTTGRISFSYTPEDKVPGRFTGKFKDQQVDGSLVISAGVDVAEPGNFVIDGTLLDREGAPLGRATFMGRLEVGASAIDLTFYGLMFREKAADGPYTLRYVRGHRASPGDTPARTDMPMYAGDYHTAGYSAESFTDSEWGEGGYPGG